MNQHVMPRVPILILSTLLLAACSQEPQGPQLIEPEGPPPLQGASLGGDFTLTGEDGNPVSFSDFDGQYRTIYFGYAFCPDVCPTDNQRAMAGLKRFEQDFPELGAKVQPLFVSVDPGRDTSEVLAEFTDAFHPRLIGMTGDARQLEEVAGQFGVFFSVPEDRGDGGYLVDHSNLTLLFGPDGSPLATLPTDQGPDAVRDELAKWVR
ncbi:SCO family protein [Qipengyuania aquimaris]|uniref:SCO family protein n=1 Tax=Qipengyuania aquimaris TaxID=255984 RepID=UPI001FD128C4|nr:SCO family protein [Qipengyuania aquimaris]UOR16710.1 SCO family protein [Qipengyuania aquimaris]